MLTVVIKRSDEPKVIQLTQENIMRELNNIVGSEMLLTDTWQEGLKQVRTPYVCLVEADCVLSSGYLTSNFSLFKKNNPKGGGNMKLSMLTSCLGIKTFGNRVFSYKAQFTEEKDGQLDFGRTRMAPVIMKTHTGIYPVEVGFIPGAICRMTAIQEIVDTFDWDQPDLVKMSTELCFHMWHTNRRVESNPNTTYVSNEDNLDKTSLFDVQIPAEVHNIFRRESI